MIRFPLRDIAGRLAGAPDIDQTLASLLSYLHAVQPHWRASVALRSRSGEERFESVAWLDDGRLRRRDSAMTFGELPTRLVRKFIRPSAFFTTGGRRELLERLFHGSASWMPDAIEAHRLEPLVDRAGWESCVLLPLNDRSELIGLLVITSDRPNAFGTAIVEALQPLRGLASLALARRLQPADAAPAHGAEDDATRRAHAALLDRVRELEADLERVTAENEARGATLRSLMHQVEWARESDGAADEAHARELERERARAAALEEQVASAGELLATAYAQAVETHSRTNEAESTLAFVREAFDVIAADPEPESLVRRFVAWFSERLHAERCSLMRLDDEGGDLRILAHRGLDPVRAAGVRVALGQGVSGWVARNRRPVLVRENAEDAPVRIGGLAEYNSDSFMSVPLVHGRHLVGVLNLSNKRAGEPFSELDLERAELASHVLAMSLGRDAGDAGADDDDWRMAA